MYISLYIQVSEENEAELLLRAIRGVKEEGEHSQNEQRQGSKDVELGEAATKQ